MSMPEPDPKPKTDPNAKKPSPGVPPTPGWRFWVAQAGLALLMLWMWQESIRVTVQHVRYSEFKRYLIEGKVTECEITEDHIIGKIDPRLGAATATGQPAETKAPTPKSTDGTEPRGKAEPTLGKSASAEAKVAPSKKDAKAAPPAKSVGKSEKPTTTAPEKKPKDGEQKKEEEKVETEPFQFRTVRVEDPELVGQLEAAHVKFEGVRPGFLSTFLWSWLVPIGLMFLLWMFLMRRLGGASQSVLSFAKNKAKLVADNDTGVTFDDVAGCDEAKVELEEVVDFLKRPARYESLGAKIPTGVLLLGPPGTGKTLLARAVAGEAKVPFFSLSGSDFVEMFVGVGAARVRDLFGQAKEHAPCIIFIDELDAIGRQRGVHVGAVNDEREQTLNQLLVEMDGFSGTVGVIILAATNRPDVLDRALMRPGRFDRQVIVDSPDMDGREAILKVHARDKRLAADVDLRKVAHGTPGFSGADLSNALNEAALLAARHGRDRIGQRDLEEAIEKVVAGPERKSRRMNDEERRCVAYHEVGHALVAAYCEHSDPLHKISIIPRGRAALGYAMHMPAEDRFLMSQAELLDRIRALLGGRAAEEVVFGEVTTGAENDLDKATGLAQQMVCLFGMSDSVGLTHIGRQQASFLPDGSTFQRDCSPETSREVDQEIKEVLDGAYADAKRILSEHRDEIEAVSGELLTRESISGERFLDLIGKTEPSSGESSGSADDVADPPASAPAPET